MLSEPYTESAGSSPLGLFRLLSYLLLSLYKHHHHYITTISPFPPFPSFILASLHLFSILLFLHIIAPLQATLTQQLSLIHSVFHNPMILIFKNISFTLSFLFSSSSYLISSHIIIPCFLYLSSFFYCYKQDGLGRVCRK